MTYGFFTNAIVYIKFDWLIIIKQCIGYAYVIFLGVWICISKKYFLTQDKMVLSSVISLNEMKSLVLTKRETHQEISNILKERHPVMRGVSAMNVRRFCNKNGKNLSFIPPKQVPDKTFTPYLLSLSCVKVSGNCGTK